VRESGKRETIQRNCKRKGVDYKGKGLTEGKRTKGVFAGGLSCEDGEQTKERVPSKGDTEAGSLEHTCSNLRVLGHPLYIVLGGDRVKASHGHELVEETRGRNDWNQKSCEEI